MTQTFTKKFSCFAESIWSIACLHLGRPNKSVQNNMLIPKQTGLDLLWQQQSAEMSERISAYCAYLILKTMALVRYGSNSTRLFSCMFFPLYPRISCHLSTVYFLMKGIKSPPKYLLLIFCLWRAATNDYFHNLLMFCISLWLSTYGLDQGGCQMHLGEKMQCNNVYVGCVSNLSAAVRCFLPPPGRQWCRGCEAGPCSGYNTPLLRLELRTGPCCSHDTHTHAHTDKEREQVRCQVFPISHVQDCVSRE